MNKQFPYLNISSQEDKVKIKIESIWLNYRKKIII